MKIQRFITTNLFNLIFLILLWNADHLLGQAIPKANSLNSDTLNITKESDLINEYFRRQRNLTLQFEDTLTEIKKKDSTIPDGHTKLKFIILCFNISKSYNEEIISLNKIAKEYEIYLSSIVIRAVDLDKYKEIFTIKEFNSLQSFIKNKSELQKQSTSFPVILILDKNGQILNAWSGDKTEDGLKTEDYYAKIIAGLESIPK